MNILFSNTTLYNTKELKNKLEISDHEFPVHDLLCYAYEKFGEMMVSPLDGDFSFVLYDSEKKYYFCARDPLGIKALYFTKVEGNYTFSSNIDELLTPPNIQKKPNLKSMRTMLYANAVDYTDTMYEGVYRLPPGHSMTIKNGNEQIKRYWYPEKIERNDIITEKEAAKKIHTLFSEAIAKRVSNLEETAFEVSGGLDSSSVVSLLGQSIPPANIDSYSLKFKGLKCDEGMYVDSILDKYPLPHQKISVANLDYSQTYSLASLYTMSPNWPIGLTFAMALPLYEKIKSDKKKIVITGQGGDHIFTGNAYVYYDLFKRFKFLTLYHELKMTHKPWQTIKTSILKPLLGENRVHFIKKLLRKKETNPFFKKNNQIRDLSQVSTIANLAFKNDLDSVTSAMYSTIMDGNLLHCMEEHFNIEFRHPYFDLELVEFALSLPPEFKYNSGKTKWILRQAMNGILPDKIKDRTDKAEFSEIIMQQVDTIDIGSLLEDSYIARLGIIEQNMIEKIRKEYEDKTIKNILILWKIINMEYWYRYNFEKESLSVSSRNEKSTKW